LVQLRACRVQPTLVSAPRVLSRQHGFILRPGAWPRAPGHSQITPAHHKSHSPFLPNHTQHSGSSERRDFGSTFAAAVRDGSCPTGAGPPRIQPPGKQGLSPAYRFISITKKKHRQVHHSTAVMRPCAFVRAPKLFGRPARFLFARRTPLYSGGSGRTPPFGFC